MRHSKTLADRQADQLKAKAKLAERLNQRMQRRESPGPGKPSDQNAGLSEVLADVVARSPWKDVRFTTPTFRYYSNTPETEATEIFVQPWAKALLNVVLEAADRGGIHLCLLWPVEFNQPAMLHGLSNLQRNFSGDMKGLRTLLYPGSHTSRLALQSVRVGREELVALYLARWTKDTGGTTFHAATRSVAYEALLDALNDIEFLNNPAVDPPLGALIPCFVHEADSTGWLSSARSQLEAVVRKVNRRAYRQDARERIASEWTNPGAAPGALMVMHNTATKKAWKSAFAAKPLLVEGRPECILLDASMAAAKANSNAVHRIPEFIRLSREGGLQDCGTVMVTDDPRTYFVLRARLAEMRLPVQEHVWAAEADHAIFSPTPRRDDWKPDLRSNANCHVGIVDREAADVAAKFQRLAAEVGGDDHPGHRLLIEACLFVLRLSNMPAGVRDLADELAEHTEDSFNSAKFSWSGVVTNLHAAIESGVLSAKRLQVERAIERAQSLITDWIESTPMAEKLLADVQAHATRGRSSLVVVLQNRSYISLARRFLQRRLGQSWSDVEHRLNWHTLSSFSFLLDEEHKNQYYIVVGFNQRVMRLLLTHPALPHGTNVLLSCKQAEGALKTLAGMKGIEAFMPYRGRIGLLMHELDRRLKELSSPPDFGKIGEFTLAFDLNQISRATNYGEQACFRFDLDGGGRLYASGWVYRYDIEEGPAFRRIPAKEIVAGDLIFDMGDDLRSKLEEALHLTGNWSSGVNYPERQLLKLYHDEVQARCVQFFPDATNRASLARQILEQMIGINDDARECRPERIQYWLDLGDESDQRPHAPKEAKYFRMFCQALNISTEQTELNWAYVRSARRLNQDMGRVLAARYAEILFHPESAIAYRKVPPAVISTLQEEAVQSVYRVARVISPEAVSHNEVTDACHK